MFNFFKKTIIFTVIIGILCPWSFLLAEDFDYNAMCDQGGWEQQCQILEQKQCEELCNKCLTYLNEKQAKVEQEISTTGQKKNTLQSQVTSLANKIKNLDYQIYQSKISIKSLEFQITDTEGSIKQTSVEIEDQKKKIAELLRAVYEEDNKSFLDVLVVSDSISEFFDNLLYLETLSNKNKEVLNNFQELESGLKIKKTNLEDETEELNNLVIIQNLKKDESSKTKIEQEYYLGITEKEYQAKLQEKEEIKKKATEISHRLFELIGTQDGGIEFGQAVEIAKYVESVTKVRAAFILAIIHQESYNKGLFGGNVGQCYVTNFTTGSGTDLKGNIKSRVMSPKDVPIFLETIKALGMEASKTPVSCWMPLYSKGVPYGWGGAMGPAQFIPSTWNLYSKKVSEITGKPANPWNIKDAFLAAGLLLKDNGAATNEFKAAMRYFSGSSWTKQEEFYGNSVVAKAAAYQKDIELLEQAETASN